MSRDKTQSGITLIALVITIIVMLILVGVTVSTAINGGLFGMAKKAKSQTEEARDIEKELANGRILVGDTWYDSMSDYVNGNRSEDQSEGGTYFTAKKEEGYLTENATYKSGGYTATIPKGFKVSEVAGEDKIETGLVIKDKDGNEFVWIPVTEDLKNSYNTTISDGSYSYSEPTKLTDIDDTSEAVYDSQEILDYYYGQGKYTYNESAYEKEYEEMVSQVNKYDGFYIGKYETTIDENNKIGSKYNTPVLSSATKLDETHIYRWYGLYYEQKDTESVTGNKVYVQTAMIYGQLWDKTMEFIRKQKEAGKTSYDVDNSMSDWHNSSSGVVNAGRTTYGDIAINIWDLESNSMEWTQEAISAGNRVYRGGCYKHNFRAKTRNVINYGYPNNFFTLMGSRLILYIKN